MQSLIRENTGKDTVIENGQTQSYHVQDNVDVEHKYLKMYWDTNQFPTLKFCGSHPKPHGARGLSKHYHLRFDPKLGHGIC